MTAEKAEEARRFATPDMSADSSPQGRAWERGGGVEGTWDFK